MNRWKSGKIAVHAVSAVTELFVGLIRKSNPKRRSGSAHRLETLEDRTVPAGTWTALSNVMPAHNPSGSETMMLLTDGTVMVQGGGQDGNNVAAKNWLRLTPDSSGNYVNGTWSNLANMNTERLFFGSTVLVDGRVMVLGGEYSGPATTNNWINTGEIYDPVANSWTNIPNFPETQFGDDTTILLPDGRVLATHLSTPRTHIYDPTTNTWTAGPTKIHGDPSDEETFVKLPDGSILTYDINVFGASTRNSQRLDPNTLTWVDSGFSPVQLETNSGKEIGAALLLPDGRVFYIGATSTTALYTPPAGGIGTGTWVAGPAIPNALGANDAPAAMEIDGKVLLIVGDTPGFGSPGSYQTAMFEYDPIANVITPIAAPPGSNLSDVPAYNTRMLSLPNGQVLFNNASDQLWVYTPAGNANSAWLPTVNGIVENGATAFTLSGTQLNGMSEGSSYGDDAEMSTNYPIVRLTNGAGTVKYGRTTNWSSTGVQTGSQIVTTDFTMPSGFGPGAYLLAVSASGLVSTNTLFVDMGTGANNIVMRVKPSDSTRVQVLQGASVLSEFALNSFSQILVVGDPSSDALTLDLSNGNFVPAGGIKYNGDSPAFFNNPGDTLNAPVGSTITLTGPGAGTIAGVGSYSNVENVAGGPFTLNISTTSLFVGNNVGADTIRLVRNGTRLEAYVNGNLDGSFTYSSVGTINVTGSSDQDTLTIDNSGGVIGRTINFSAVHVNGQDKLIIAGNPGGPTIARETYLVGGTQDAGKWVLDPDGSAGAGAQAAGLNGDELIVNFTGISPIETDTPSLNFDAIFTNAVDRTTIQNGGLLNGANSIQIFANTPTFDAVRFANKTVVRIMGSGGADAFKVNFTTNAAGLASLELDGHIAAGVAGGPPDDSANDVFELDSEFVPTLTVDGNEGSDSYDNNNVGPFASGTFNLQGLVGAGVSPTINITDTGVAGTNVAQLQDSQNAGPVTANFLAQQLTGAAPAIIHYSNLQTFFYEASAGADVINILNTSAGTNYYVAGAAGADTFTIGNTTANFNAGPGTGSLAGILGSILISGESNPVGPGSIDTLNVDASNDPALSGAATLGVNSLFDFTLAPFGATDSGAATELLNFAAAPIRYRHATSTFLPPAVNNQLELLRVRGSKGADNITINATTASTSSTFDGREGNDLFTISGSGLLNATTVSGGAGDDQFALNIDAATLSAPITFNGDANSAGARDRVTINEASDKSRTMTGTYGGGAFDLQITGLGNNVNLNAVETLQYAGNAANNDVFNVAGSASKNDLLTVAPIGANAAVVFNGGDPFDSPPPGNGGVLFKNSLPGVAGGGGGPDLYLASGVSTDGLHISDLGGTKDKLYVYGRTNGGLVDTVAQGASFDPFGFGKGFLLPDANVGDVVAIDGDSVDITGLISVNYTAADFAQPNPLLDAAVTVNTGDETNAALRDDVALVLSTAVRFQVNGGDPDPGTTGITLPQGDRLSVTSAATEFNVFSDQGSPTPNVSVVPANSPILPYGFSSFENVNQLASTLNVLGDNNGASAGQNDQYVITGIAKNDLTLEMNGSPDITFTGVQNLNVYGSQAATFSGEDGSGSGNDRVSIQPFATSLVPWGVNVSVNLQDGNDRISYSGVAGIIDNMMLSPFLDGNGKTDGNGEGQIFDSAVAAGPAVTFYNAENVNLNANSNDGDKLTISGTNGNDLFTLRFDPDRTGSNSGGDLTNSLDDLTDDDVIFANHYDVVIDDGRGLLDRSTKGPLDAPIANGFKAIDFDLGSGDDVFTLNLVGANDAAPDVEGGGAGAIPMVSGNPIAINVVGNDGSNDLLIVQGNKNQDDAISIAGGANPQSGMIAIAGTDTGSISFTTIENIQANGGSGSGTDSVNLNGGNTAGNFTVGNTGVISNFAPVVQFTNLGSTAASINLFGGAGDDSFNVSPLDNSNGGQIGSGIAINISGGAQVTGDSINIQGTTGKDVANFQPTAVDSGKLTTAGLGAVNFTTSETVLYDGNGGDDSLKFTSSAGSDTFDLTLGNQADSGSIAARQPVVGTPFPSFTFQELGAQGTLDIADASSTRADTFGIKGTTNDDRFDVTATGVVQVFDADQVGNVARSIAISTSGVNSLLPFGLNGDDVFNVNAGHPFGGGITIDGGNSVAGDVLNFTSSGGAVTYDFGGGFVQESAKNVVAFLAIETVNIDLKAANLIVNGTAANDAITYTGSGADAGSFALTGNLTNLNFTSAGAVTLEGKAGIDDLSVAGTNVDDTITTTTTAVIVNATQEVTIGASTERVNINGGDGNDTITITPTNFVIAVVDGGIGNDTIDGSAANIGISILGNAGDDQLNGTKGADNIDGGIGNDTVSGNAGNDTMFGQDGDDIMSGGDGNDLSFGAAGKDILDGGLGNDSFNGGDGNDTITGDAGIDYIEGDLGNDSLLGGDDADGFNAGDGDDLVDGGLGNDFVYGLGGNDTILGQDGADGIDAGAGNDSVDGGLGNDFMYGLDGKDTLIGNDGDDGMDGGLDDDSMLGGNGNDLLFGNFGNDNELGGAGNDSIDGNAGNDTLDGGTENDLIFASGGGIDLILGGAGNDTLQNIDAAATILAGAGNDVLYGANFTNDSLVGDDGNDTIFGLSGNDTITTGAGSDVVDGGAGFDVVTDAQVGDTVFNVP